jgi:cytochrome c-type biogenesis protein
MLQAPPKAKTRGVIYALLAAGCSTLLVGAWAWLEVVRLRGGHGGMAQALGLSGAVGSSFALICDAVGPALPYLSVALIPTALAVMAPCLLQMSIVLVSAISGVAAQAGGARPNLWRQGLAFAAGFLGIYAVAALVLGLVGQGVGSYAAVLKALGGVLVLLLGLAVLRALPRTALSGCRGPRWLIMTGKATLRRPLAAGVAFAVYCVGCCGPYLSGLALLGAGSGSLWQGAALVLAFALLMGGLLLLPIFALPLSQRVGQVLARHAAPVTTVSGVTLVAIGTALALEPLVVWALA